jgi:hypothetical protein
MVHRCDFSRDITAGTNDSRTFRPNAAAQAVMCRLWAEAGREAAGPERVAVVEDLRAIVPLGTDVNERDVITQVRDRRGRAVDPRQLEILTVLARRDHLELVLQAISS